MKPSKNKKSSRNRSLERACDEAILDTLRYSAVFNCSVTFSQLTTFLLAKKRFEYALIKKRLQALLRSKHIGVKKSCYFISDIKPLSWQRRAAYSLKHIENAQLAFDILRRVKWIKMLAITGSVAAYNAQKDDDIDLFIVTDKDRLWLTRLFVVLLLKSMNMYLSSEGSVTRFCPNIYVDISKLTWPEEKRNIYIAHDILLMHPYINLDDTYFRFIKQNNWVLDYFPNIQVNCPTKFVSSRNKYNSKLVDVLEYCSMKLQRFYMRKNQTTEVTTRHVIHFNKTDHTERIINKYTELTNK
jgi:hypothetical protein